MPVRSRSPAPLFRPGQSVFLPDPHRHASLVVRAACAKHFDVRDPLLVLRAQQASASPGRSAHRDRLRWCDRAPRWRVGRSTPRAGWSGRDGPSALGSSRQFVPPSCRPSAEDRGNAIRRRRLLGAPLQTWMTSWNAREEHPARRHRPKCSRRWWPSPVSLKSRSPSGS